MNKKALSQRDICSKFIARALRKTVCGEMLNIRENVATYA